ncbi:hypothetical protein FRC00_007627 [Tulasnella sp. 408]|nr:hypothetical protein FRC00_007627 [Tulasnella sp. 408]
MEVMEADAASASTAGPSRSPTPPQEPQLPAQPAFFYPGGHNTAHQIREGEIVSPDQDPFAARGIPVFKPTYEEFQDFEKYMERVEPWGRKSGIVKIIPPAEWSNALPPVNPLLPSLKLKNPIEQHMLGQSGLFRQSNVEKRRTLTLKDWADLCNKPEMRANPIKNGEVQTRGLRGTPRKPARRSRKNKNEAKEKEEDVVEQATALPDEDDESRETGGPSRKKASDSAVASNYPTPQATPKNDVQEKPEESNQATSAATPEVTVDPFFASFNPKRSWLPEDTNPEDYTPDACRELERLYWRTCGLGTPPLYGADMAGSLFTDDTKHWNVANLPSFLARLCKNKAIPGVNTPYLYFGMWRATFAWHVEDMDLYSINYIHWGAPKYWYAIPSGRSKAFEGVMKGLFPGDATGCPQYLRHKSYLASPTLLASSSCRPNTLVQHQGEFVITYPRGYHAGFNLGLNCAESVNFALESWIELGRKAGVCTCVGDSVRIDVDALLNSAEEQRDEEHAAAEMERKRKREDEPNGDDAEGRPKRIKKITIKYDPSDLPPSAAETSGSQSHDSRPRVRLPPMPPTPCCLCASASEEGLLRVHDPPQPSAAARPQMKKDAEGNTVAVWRAHENCARVIPDTWVDEVNGEKLVFGVDVIDKDRWALKCCVCTRTTLKTHGAKIQCTRGKCIKAFHVTCAATSSDMVYRELQEVEKEVVLTNPPPDAQMQSALTTSDDPAKETSGSSAQGVVKTIKKPTVEVLCSQHNPVNMERKKQAKSDQIRQDALALEPESRIKIRTSSGVYEVMVTSVDSVRETVAVAWGGHRREFSWKSVVWGDLAPGTVVKKADEDMLPARNYIPVPAVGQQPKPPVQPQANSTLPSNKHAQSTKSQSVPKSTPAVPVQAPYGYPYLHAQYPVPVHPSAYPYRPPYQYYQAHALYLNQAQSSTGTAQGGSQTAPQTPQWPPYTPGYYPGYGHPGAYYPPYAAYVSPAGLPNYYNPHVHPNAGAAPAQSSSTAAQPPPANPTPKAAAPAPNTSSAVSVSGSGST